jgi:hypothetical protein
MVDTLTCFLLSLSLLFCAYAEMDKYNGKFEDSGNHGVKHLPNGCRPSQSLNDLYTSKKHQSLSNEDRLQPAMKLMGQGEISTTWGTKKSTAMGDTRLQGYHVMHPIPRIDEQLQMTQSDVNISDLFVPDETDRRDHVDSIGTRFQLGHSLEQEITQLFSLGPTPTLSVHGVPSTKTLTAENDSMPPMICTFAHLPHNQSTDSPVNWYDVRSQPTDAVDFLTSDLPAGSHLSRRAPSFGPCILPTHDSLNNWL